MKILGTTQNAKQKMCGRAESEHTGSYSRGCWVGVGIRAIPIAYVTTEEMTMRTCLRAAKTRPPSSSDSVIIWAAMSSGQSHVPISSKDN